MNILLMLIPVALVIVAIAVWFFFWAVKTNQFEDLDRQGANILFDDELVKPPVLSSQKRSKKNFTDDNVANSDQQP